MDTCLADIKPKAGRSRSGRSRLRAGIALVCALWTPATTLAVDAETLRASYIQNLSKFVEWPATALPAATETFTVCVQGDEILNTISSSLQDQKIGSRTFVVSALSRHPKGEGCHVLFINSSEIWRLTNILAEIRGRPILTIADAAPFAKSGGMIELIPADGRLVFEINQGVIERAGLKVSSKVLTLARAVYR